MSANIPNNPPAIQRLFTSRDNNANSATYVGQEQRLWYDPTTNAIYVSDGNTAGGVMVGAGGSGNGVAGGPTNSIQYNAGAGAFGGTANLIISGNGVSVVGNVTSAYFIGNGSQLTGLAATYGNANVATFLGAFGSNAISTSGNITGNYFIGDGSQLTNLPGGGNYGNANVTALLASGIVTTNIITDGNIFAPGKDSIITSAGNISSGKNIVATGNLTASLNVLAGNNVSAANNVSAGNILTSGVVSATGNITGNYFIGNGALLTGINVSSNAIFNGTSNVNIASANANITVGVNGTNNVAIFTNTGISVNGNITVTDTVDANLVTAESGLFLNANTITANYTIPPGYNALSGGPITIPDGIVVNTTNSNWGIV